MHFPAFADTDYYKKFYYINSVEYVLIEIKLPQSSFYLKEIALRTYKLVFQETSAHVIKKCFHTLYTSNKIS